jgi:hypothetical protein
VSELIFRVEGFGEVGLANLYAFIPFDGFKQPGDLAVNEETEGRFANPTSDKRPERITRIK